jgi:hypothetical protein
MFQGSGSGSGRRRHSLVPSARPTLMLLNHLSSSCSHCACLDIGCGISLDQQLQRGYQPSGRCILKPLHRPASTILLSILNVGHCQTSQRRFYLSPHLLRPAKSLCLRSQICKWCFLGVMRSLGVNSMLCCKQAMVCNEQASGARAH